MPSFAYASDPFYVNGELRGLLQASRDQESRFPIFEAIPAQGSTEFQCDGATACRAHGTGHRDVWLSPAEFPRRECAGRLRKI